MVASLRLVEEILEFAGRNASEIRQVVQDVDSSSLVGTEVPVRTTFQRSAEQVEILMGEVEVVTNPYSGRRMSQRLEVSTPETMYEFGTFFATETVVTPRAYVVPIELTAVFERLERHGIRTDPLPPGPTQSVERFRISSSTVATRAFQGHQERTVEGTWEAVELQLPDAVEVPPDQPLGRLAVYLLEPHSDDGLLNWNLLDREIEGGSYPILRIPPR